MIDSNSWRNLRLLSGWEGWGIICTEKWYEQPVSQSLRMTVYSEWKKVVPGMPQFWGHLMGRLKSGWTYLGHYSGQRSNVHVQFIFFRVKRQYTGQKLVCLSYSVWVTLSFVFRNIAPVINYRKWRWLLIITTKLWIKTNYSSHKCVILFRDRVLPVSRIQEK